MRIVYFHIYNAYYKDGNFNNDIPHLTAFGIVGSSLSFLLMTMGIIVNSYYGREKISESVYTITMVFFLVIFSLIFLYNRKYNVIYNEIKDSKWGNLFYKIISWFVIFLGYALFSLVVLRLGNII